MTILRIITHRPDLGPKEPIFPLLTAPELEALQAARPETPPLFVGDGPKLWGELHRWALGAFIKGKAAQAELELYLAKEFAQKLPCGHCRAHWLEMLGNTPPDFRSPMKLFEWTVARHNEVNSRLGKPLVSAGAAHRRWFPRKRQKRAKNA